MGSMDRSRWLAALALVLGSVLAASAPRPSLAGGAAEPDLWVELPAAATPLAELGAYRVAYQLYGQKRVEMPVSWSGDFTEDVGIAYYPAGVRGGRRAHVLHCPWKAGTGLVSLEYFLKLPSRKPITLTLGIAMRADITAKSDGVTFSASVVADGARTELFREHYTKAAWKDISFDLSAYAGRRIVLAFQAEPGPENNAGFDFSMLGEPTLVAGPARDTRRELLREIVRSRAYQSTARRDLTKLANDPRQGVVPSTNDPHKASVRLQRVDLVDPTTGGRAKARDSYVFEYRGDDCLILYLYHPRTGSPADLAVSAGGGPLFRPCQGGGIRLAPDPKKPDVHKAPETARLVSHRLEGDTVTAVWRYQFGKLTADVTWTFRLVGKALAITAKSDSQAIAHFSLGQPWTKGRRRVVPIPYQNYARVLFLRPQNVYVMSTLDWTKSMASRTPGSEAVYTPRIDGTRNKLHEEGYVAVSPELGEVLPNIPHAPSPFLKLLAPKIVLDIWGGSYDRGAEILRTLKSYGVDHAAVIWHNWQRYGYDVKLPDHLPANPALGGDEAMKRLAAAAREVGYPFSLHENYIDFYPDAPSYNPKDIVLTPKGSYSKAWYHAGTKVQSFALKAGRMLHYAAQNSPEIHRRFGTTAAYLDVHTCVPPWHHVDYDPATRFAGSHHLKVLVHARLFQFERDTHGGPLFGEGHNHFFWAGLVDGVEAQVAGGEDAPLLLDYDLLKVHPQMVNHGMGYYTRWLRTGRQTKWGTEAPTPAQLDKYRATTLAYGHAGFVGSQCVYVPHLAWREHNLVAPVQALYGAAKATEILYDADGQLVTSSAAAPSGTLDRVRVAYDSGLVLHVNLREGDWPVDGHVVPQFGFLAKGPGLLAWTARKQGVIADYAEDARTLFADARTHVYRPWAHQLKQIEPRLAKLRDLGDGAFEITYAWNVGQALDRDYTAFVHFVDPDAEESEGIRFQNDHQPKTPTSAWRPGQAVVDGPHRVEVPRGQGLKVYDIVIGLYKPGASRLALRGTDAGGQRILIGRLAVERREGRVVAVKTLPVADRRAEQLARRRLFDQRMNTGGKLIDFGKVRTDGSFKVYKRKASLTLLPYPRDKAFAVQLDIPQLLPGRRAAQAALAAFDADAKPLKAPRTTADGSWLAFRAGTPGAARYEITFPGTKEP